LNRGNALELDEVDPIVFSEALSDVARLAARGAASATA
jgi:hypothetical protein